MTVVKAPLCMGCQHFRVADKMKNACAAFPDGIPDAIFLSKIEHRQPYPGDHGIQFEPKKEPV
jgi:hypothetical protein